MRKFIKKLHLYVALAFFIPLLLQSTTGMMMVFQKEISNYFLLKNYQITQGNNHSTQEIIDVATPALKENSIVTLVKFEENGLVKIRSDKSEEIVIDPVSLKIVGQKNIKESFFYLIKKFHTHLLIDSPISHNFIGFVGIALLFLSISGIIIWWPKNLEKLRASVKFSFYDIGYRFQKTLHKSLGFWFFITLTAISFSGVYMVFKSSPAPIKVLPTNAQKISIIDAEILAKKSLNNDELKLVSINLSLKPDAPFLLNFNDGSKAFTTSVIIDPYQKEVLQIRSSREFELVEKFLVMQHPIHTGEIFGILGKVLMFLTALTPFIFTYSGIYMWWMKKDKPKPIKNPPH